MSWCPIDELKLQEVSREGQNQGADSTDNRPNKHGPSCLIFKITVLLSCNDLECDFSGVGPMLHKDKEVSNNSQLRKENNEQ